MTHRLYVGGVADERLCVCASLVNGGAEPKRGPVPRHLEDLRLVPSDPRARLHEAKYDARARGIYDAAPR
jgi:hypothetical protein